MKLITMFIVQIVLVAVFFIILASVINNLSKTRLGQKAGYWLSEPNSALVEEK